MNDEIQDNLKPLYRCYSQYKMLFNYYQNNKSMRSKEEIQERIDYITKNKVNQRSEIETLMWILEADKDVDN